MIRHILLIRFTHSATVKQIGAVKNAFLAISNRIPGIRSVEWGENDSLEGKSAGFTHCVLMTFQDETARQQYLPHPEHIALKKVFEPILQDIVVFDYALSGGTFKNAKLRSMR